MSEEPGAAPPGLLSPAFLARLERLRVASKRLLAAKTAGERRSAALGSSVEFADHRDYHFGDDPRYLDWNAYARLERLFVKLFHQEADLAVHILLDASASMGCGESSKFLLARRLASGLAYATLANFDRAGLMTLGGKPALTRLPARGRGQIRRLLGLLDELAPAGEPDPVRELSRYAALQKRPGVAVLISDMLDPRLQEGLRVLLHHRHELWVLHILSPEDRGEGLEGELELVDSESGRTRSVSATPAVLEAYRRTVGEFRAGLETFCRERRIGYQFVDAGADFESTLLTALRRRRLLSP